MAQLYLDKTRYWQRQTVRPVKVIVVTKTRILEAAIERYYSVEKRADIDQRRSL